VDEQILEQAISLHSIKEIIKLPSGGKILKIIVDAKIDIDAARAACESAVVPGLSSRERSDAYILIAKRLKDSNLSDFTILFHHKAVLADPDNPTAWMEHGEFYLGQGNFIAAIACFLKISSLIAKVHIAKILNTFGWHDQSIMYLNFLSPTKDENKIVCPVKAECFAAKGDYQNALIELNKILDDDTDPHIWHQYAQFSCKTGKDGELIRALPHILPLWSYSGGNKNAINYYFSKGEDQEWLKKTLPKSGIYYLNKKEANWFLVASLISHRQKSERITARINSFLLREGATPENLWQVIARTDLNAWKSYPLEQRLHPNANRHEMVHRMAVFLEKYGGDARGLWSGVTRGEVLRRLDEIGFKDTINDFIIRTLSESRRALKEEDNKWNNDRHINRITARFMLGEDTLPDHPDVVYAIREHFRNSDDILHWIGINYCLVKEYRCSLCLFMKVCTKYQKEGSKERKFWWDLLTSDEEEPETFYFTLGEEVHLVGTSVHGAVTEKIQVSQEEFINLESNEGFLSEIGSFYALIKDHPLIRNLNC
jgi:tetratricopeptide (TPR) repeat protein